MAAKVLDRSAATVPAELLAAVVERFDPIEVILFGSRARGDAGPDSDWDLLVVVDDKAAAPARAACRSRVARGSDGDPVLPVQLRGRPRP